MSNLVKLLRYQARMWKVPEDQIESKAADRIEELEAALKLAIEMRAQQNLYFKDRTKDALIDSKMAEAAFDRAALGAGK